MKIHLKSISLVSLRYLRNYCFLYFLNSQKPCGFQESPLLSNLSYMYIKIERNEIALGYSPQHCRCSFKQIWRHWPVKASHPGSHRPGRWARYPCSQTPHLDEWNNHRSKLISESGIMNTDRVDGVCLLEGIVIGTAWIIWVWNCNRLGSFSKLISKTDCTSTVNHLFKCKVKDHARSKKIKICKHIKRYKIYILYIDT